MKIVSFLLLFLLFSSCFSKQPQQKQSIQITDTSIIYNKERDSLSLEYLKKHYGIVTQSTKIIPKIIVVHWTELSFEKTMEMFYEPSLNGKRKDLGNQKSVNVSSQYLIDREGKIFRLMPDNKFARHIIGLNHCAIGIENVGGKEYSPPLTEKQLKANENLIRYLKNKYDSTLEYVIGHYQYRKFENHELWKEIDPNYRTKKIDPGEEFLKKLLKNIKDLELKNVPN